MEIVLMSIGKTKTQSFIEQINDYLSRLKYFTKFTMTYLPDIKNSANMSKEKIKLEEGKIILNAITSMDYIVLLDERGKELSSPEFSQWIEGLMMKSSKKIIFIIGGPYGFSKEVYARANSKIALSKMTFTHEMVRLFFIEQLYRAFTIINGLPYHH